MDWFYYNPVALYAGTGAFDALAKQIAVFNKILLVTSPGMVRRESAKRLVRGLGGKWAASASKTHSACACTTDEHAGSGHAVCAGSDSEAVAGEGVARQGVSEKIVSEKNTVGEGGCGGCSSARTGAAEWMVATVGPNPDVLGLQALIRKFSRKGIEAIVAFGGGSVMDSAKVLAVALAHEASGGACCGEGEEKAQKEFDIRYFFSHHHEAAAFLPYYCIPTTSGTGAEVTPFGTVWDNEARKKYSFSAKDLFATAAFLEPSTTVSLPRKETLYGAMDAMSHALETLWNRNASLMGQSFARKAIAMVCEAYPLVVNNPCDTGARLRLQEASTLAGLAISQSRSALAHSMSYPLTSHYDVPHGLACSFTLPAIIELVTEKNLWPSEEDELLALKAATFMGGLELAKHVAEYCTREDVLALAGEMFAPGRVENFIVPITSEEVLGILQKSLGE